MRTASGTVTNAVTIPVEHKIETRLTVYKSRIYFDDTLEDWFKHYKNAVSDIPTVPEENTVTGNPYNMAISLVNRNGYSSSVESALAIWSIGNTAFHTDGHLCFNGTAITTITPSFSSRVGCWNEGNVYNTCAVWYRDTASSPKWIRRVCTLDENVDFEIYPTTIGAEVTYNTTLGAGAIYPVSYTEAIILDIYQGGVRPSFIDIDGIVHSSSRRFMNPLKVLDDTTDDIYVTHYGGAVKVSDGIMVYFTDYTGAVKVIKYTFSANNKDGAWSDIQTAVPADQSQFIIGNVFLVGSRIFICGKFYREEQFASTTADTLLVWSDNGFTFTLNRRTLVTMRNLRWQAVYDPGQSKAVSNLIYFIAPGPIYSTPAPYQVIGETSEKIIVDLLSVSGSITGELSCNIRAGSEEYFDESILDTGSYAKLEIRQYTTAGIEDVKYHDVIVSAITKSIKDGDRRQSISLQLDGAWHTSNMSHPFYMEFQGKQSIYENFLTEGNMVHASVGTNPRWALSVDFWASDGTAMNFTTHGESTTTDHLTSDLNTKFTSYPVFGTEANYEFKLYGWSRAGIPDTNPNTADTTNTATLNDKFYLLYETQDSGGQVTLNVATDAQLTSTYQNPPQTWFVEGARAGSCPVIYTIPNPGAGTIITRLGIRVISGAAGHTTYNLERIEAPMISCEPLTGFVSDEIEYGTDGNGGKVTNTRKAVPQILFSSRPYSAWNFDQAVRAQITGSYSAVGLVGLANDKFNFILGYIREGYAGISKFSNGVETKLTEVTDASIVTGSRFDIRFWHTDGTFGLEYKLTSVLAWPNRGSQITHSWQTSDGVMAASDDLYHVGTYSLIDPPRFQITGFMSRGSVIGVMPIDVDIKTNTSDFLTEFPTSGVIDIDTIKYNYTGKSAGLTANQCRGPFQLRNTREWPSPYNQEYDGTYTYQGGKAIEFLMFNWAKSPTDYAGNIIATSAGYAWANSQTQWISYIKTGGVKVFLRNRARFYSGDEPDWYDSCDEKCWITNGLTGVTAAETDDAEYLHQSGSWAFLHSDDSVVLYEYYAVSGENDQTIHSLLKTLSEIAGTEAVFPGDYNIATVTSNRKFALQKNTLIAEPLSILITGHSVTLMKA